MAKLKINIYEGRKIEKSYEANDYEMMFGTLEDLLKLAENVEDENQLIKQMDILHPFIKEIFPEITDEEIRRTKVKDLFRIMQQAMEFAVAQIGADEKN